MGNTFAIDATVLKDKYDEIENGLLENVYGLPVYIESQVGDNLMRGDVYGIFYHPHKKVAQSLAILENWCEIMPQHLNIKACTYERIDKQCKLTFYSGRKFYEKADEVYQLNYHFQIKALSETYFNATLDAVKGPIGTRDYLISVEAIPLSEDSTIFHLGYEYKYGFLASIGMSTYLSTLGRNKIGFTIKERDKNNQPVYIDGVRGVIERNAIRYYFAILSFLNTEEVKSSQRFAARISQWFDLTEGYHLQLYEMDKTDYLDYKRRERVDQLRLQNVINDRTNMTKTVMPVASTCMSTE